MLETSRGVAARREGAVRPARAKADPMVVGRRFVQEGYDGWESAKTIRLVGRFGKSVKQGSRYRVTIERPAKFPETRPSVRLVEILPEPLGL